MRRILVLTDIYYPEEQSTGYLLTKTAEGLANHTDVRVITGPASSFFTLQATPHHEFRKSVEIFRCRGTSLSNHNLVSRVVNMLTRSLSILWQGLRLARQNDVLLVVTNPPLLPFIAL